MVFSFSPFFYSGWCRGEKRRPLQNTEGGIGKKGGKRERGPIQGQIGLPKAPLKEWTKSWVGCAVCCLKNCQ